MHKFIFLDVDGQTMAEGSCHQFMAIFRVCEYYGIVRFHVRPKTRPQQPFGYTNLKGHAQVLNHQKIGDDFRPGHVALNIFFNLLNK